eukprot:jgi/Psemu1/16421/gm1.16421_g
MQCGVAMIDTVVIAATPALRWHYQIYVCSVHAAWGPTQYVLHLIMNFTNPDIPCLSYLRALDPCDECEYHKIVLVFSNACQDLTILPQPNWQEEWRQCLTHGPRKRCNQLMMVGERGVNIYPETSDGFQDAIDIQCYNNVGIGQQVQSGEQERLKLNGHTFPPKQWCNLMQEARKHIKECIDFNPEAFIEKYRRRYIEEADDGKERNKEMEKNKIKDNWNSFMNKATKQSTQRKKRKLKQLANKEKRDEEDGNERNIVHWLHLYKKRWKSPRRFRGKVVYKLAIKEFKNGILTVTYLHRRSKKDYKSLLISPAFTIDSILFVSKPAIDKVVIFTTEVLDHGNFRLDRIAVKQI